MDKTFEQWRRGFNSCEQCATSAYNKIQSLESELTSKQWVIDRLLKKIEERDEKATKV